MIPIELKERAELVVGDVFPDLPEAQEAFLTELEDKDPALYGEIRLAMAETEPEDEDLETHKGTWNNPVIHKMVQAMKKRDKFWSGVQSVFYTTDPLGKPALKKRLVLTLGMITMVALLAPPLARNFLPRGGTPEKTVEAQPNPLAAPGTETAPAAEASAATTFQNELKDMTPKPTAATTQQEGETPATTVEQPANLGEMSTSTPPGTTPEVSAVNTHQGTITPPPNTPHPTPAPVQAGNPPVYLENPQGSGAPPMAPLPVPVDSEKYYGQNARVIDRQVQNQPKSANLLGGNATGLSAPEGPTSQLSTPVEFSSPKTEAKKPSVYEKTPQVKSSTMYSNQTGVKPTGGNTTAAMYQKTLSASAPKGPNYQKPAATGTSNKITYQKQASQGGTGSPSNVNYQKTPTQNAENQTLYQGNTGQQGTGQNPAGTTVQRTQTQSSNTLYQKSASTQGGNAQGMSVYQKTSSNTNSGNLITSGGGQGNGQTVNNTTGGQNTQGVTVYQASNKTTASNDERVIFDRNKQGTTPPSGPASSGQDIPLAQGSVQPSPGNLQEEHSKITFKNGVSYNAGQRIPGRLLTRLELPAGATSAALVQGEDGSLWIGRASMDSNKRLAIEIERVVLAGQEVKATGKVLAMDYTFGLSGSHREVAPSLINDILRAGVSGVSNYVNALTNQKSVTFTGGNAVQSNNVPELSYMVAGNIASLFSLPPSQQTLVTVTTVEKDTPVMVVFAI